MKRLQVNETALSCSRRGSGIVLRSLHRMDAAFCLGSAAPSAGTRILAGGGPAAAWHAADRQITRCHKWMLRQIRKFVNRLDVFPRSVGKGIELQLAAVCFDHRDRSTRAALETLAAVDPGAK